MRVVYLASSRRDLHAHRRSLRAALADIGVAVISRSDLSGKPAPGGRERLIMACDAVLVIVGFHYGSLIPGDVVSYTEREFRLATSMRKPVLAFVAARQSGAADRQVLGPAVRAFRRHLAASVPTVRFASEEHLCRRAIEALNNIFGPSFDEATQRALTGTVLRPVRLHLCAGGDLARESAAAADSVHRFNQVHTEETGIFYRLCDVVCGLSHQPPSSPHASALPEREDVFLLILWKQLAGRLASSRQPQEVLKTLSQWRDGGGRLVFYLCDRPMNPAESSEIDEVVELLRRCANDLGGVRRFVAISELREGVYRDLVSLAHLDGSTGTQ